LGHNPYAAPQADLNLPFATAYVPRMIEWGGRIGRARCLAYSFVGLAFAFVYVMVVGVLGSLSGVELAINAWGTQLHTAISCWLPRQRL
jgi:hypothetical protein